VTDDTRTELRVTVERLVRLANAGVGVTCELRPERRCPPEDTPPLTTAQQLALSVLVGEPDRAVLSALCDCLIEMGHEYAAAVAEKARREERERIEKACRGRRDFWRAGGGRNGGARFAQGREMEADAILRLVAEYAEVD
jgi:hypothetical protein